MRSADRAALAAARRTTGLSAPVLAALVAEVGPRCRARQDARLADRSHRRRAAGAGAEHRLVFVDRLLATLAHRRHGATHDVWAAWFGVHRPTVGYWDCASAVSLVTGTALIILVQGAVAVTVASVYAGAVSLLFGTSAAYHRGSWSPRACARMQRLDHSMIFVLIAGTYTPLSVLLLHGAGRWVVFRAVWAGAAVGVLARNVLTRRPRWLFPALYVVLGCVALAVLPALLRAGGTLVLVMIVLGGACYLAGAVIYVRRRPDPWPSWFGFHELFHALTIAAFAAHYVAVSATVYRVR